MPLLHKKPYKRIKEPAGLDSDSLVYYLEATNEIFLDHDDYYNRMLELNSTVWTCELTRKTNLTFSEVLESENEALISLSDFPDYLEKPILFVVKNFTNRGRFEDLVNDVYFLMKDRFFINEEVTFTEKSRKITARIVGSYVVYPDENHSGALVPTSFGEELREMNSPPPENYRYTIEILDGIPGEDDVIRQGVPPEKLYRSKEIGSRRKVKLFLKNSCYIPTQGDHYIVKDAHLIDGVVNSLTWNRVMAGTEPVFPHTPVIQRGRIPNVMKPGYVEPEKKVREKKEKVETTPRPRGRPPKPEDETKNGAKTPKTPKEPKNPSAKKSRKRKSSIRNGGDAAEKSPKKKRTSGSSKNTTDNTPTKKAKVSNNPKMSEKKKLRIIEQQKELEFLFEEAKRLGVDVKGLQQEDKILNEKVIEEFKKDVKEAKEKEREQAKEERRRKAKEKLIYMKKREDLICDDLKPLPRFPSLELPPWLLPDELGEYLFILQFFCSFKDILPLKEIRGTTDVYLSDIVISIKCHDPQNSPYADLMRVLLSVRTDIADEEDGDEADISNKDEVSLINSQNCDPSNPMYGESIRESCEEHSRVRKIHGKSVRHLPIDWMTLSEVLRLIFATSGYYTGLSTHRHRLYTRGNFKGYEDPGFEFRHDHPEIMEKLETQTVFDLEPEERLEIMKAIILQLLMYSKFRNYIETRQSEMYVLKKEIKVLKGWDQGQEQEANAARIVLEQKLEKAGKSGAIETEKVVPGTALGKKLKNHLKAFNEGRRLDKHELDTILLESVPYGELDLDEIVTARTLQKEEHEKLMKDLISKIFVIYSEISDVQLGKDRAYRKYFVIDTLAAILVENPLDSDRIDYCEEASVIEKPEFLVENESQEVFVCSGSQDTCKVHGQTRNERPRWSYIRGLDQFEQFTKALNPRGFRENDMIEEINEYKPSLLEILETTQQSIENGEWEEMFMLNAKDPGDTYNIDWDSELRELFLDFEEKIDQGRMGSISTTFSVDRDSWRTNLKQLGDVLMLLNENIIIGNEVVVDLDDIREYSDVKKLAFAFLQIVRSIHLKFIKAPFTSIGKDEHGNNVPKASEMFIRWQKSLIQCESHSALSLFLSTVEPTIQWDKSRLQGKCRQCRKKGAASDLVLCFECNNCYHLLCVKLSTDEPAPNVWLCTTCQAQKRKVEMEERRRQARALENAAEISKLENGDTEESEVDSGSAPSQNITDHMDMSLDQSGPIVSIAKTVTSSGRTVKKVIYNDILVTSPAKKQNRLSRSNIIEKKPERKQRSTNGRRYEDYDENTSIDEDDDLEIDDANRRKSSRKRTPKKRLSQAFESTRDTAQHKRDKMAQLEKLLKEAMRQECSWPFSRPVDRKEVPDYYDVIKRPMDLHTMMNKIKQMTYNQPEEVRNDFNLIIGNCETYNETESEIYQASQMLLQFVAFKMDKIIDN